MTARRIPTSGRAIDIRASGEPPPAISLTQESRFHVGEFSYWPFWSDATGTLLQRYNLRMPLLSVLVASVLGFQQLSTTPRFEYSAPLPTIPGVMLDSYGTSVGLAQQMAKQRNLQARIMWIDATANLDRYNTEDKIVQLVRKIKDSGFNMIVLDIKPISGQVIYNSKLAPKLTEWKGKTMDAAFDPLAIFVREAKADGIPLHVSLNAFSEGHRMFLVGPGYARPDQQTVLYESTPILAAADSTNFPVSAKVGLIEPDKISLQANGFAFPIDSVGSYCVAINKAGMVVANAEIDQTMPTAPKGGALLFGGIGTAADYLRSHGSVGSTLKLDSQPEFVPISARPEQQYPLMMNPNDPAVQQYALDILKEVVSNYQVDGIIYDDRLRYGGQNADFSDISRRKFEAAIGQPVQWPDDVFKWTYANNLTKGTKPGKYFDQWMAWRASTIQDYVKSARKTIAAIRPQVQLAAYVGSWYGEYPRIGHNYADVDIDAGFWFLSNNYRQTGTAPLFDFLITGAYYTTSTVYDAMVNNVGIGSTVESAGTLTNRLVRDRCWTYAGLSLIDFQDNPEGLRDALQAACGSTQGVMIFDLSHNIEPMWPVFAQAFAQARVAPNTDPKNLRDLRQRRAALEKTGNYKEPAIIIAAGSAGVGQ